MALFTELKRRNVFRVAIAYAVIAWLLAQVADLAFASFGAPDWVPKSFLFLLVLGFPLAVFFAWAFELTPEGVKREKDVDRSQSITHQTGRKLNVVIISLLVIALGFLLFDKFAIRSDRPTGTLDAIGEIDKSIAVLPFENRSNREEDRFFTDGIHDDLLSTIANIGSMKVISRTSVMEYRNTTKKIPEIAAELGVATILEGGIQRSGNQVRINVQLIDASTDQHVWAETYDRELTTENLFAIQSEVSNAIAASLNATLTPKEHQRINSLPTNNIEAYEAYLLGDKRWRARESESVNESVRLFQKAVDLDPEFALAWAGLGTALVFQVDFSSAEPRKTYPKAERAVFKALALDDQLGEAHAALGLLRLAQADFEASEEALKRAIELVPNSVDVHNWYAVLFARQGRKEDALTMYQRGLELDPLSVIIRSNFAITNGQIGRFDEMREAYERVIEISPESNSGYEGISIFHRSVRGRYDDALLWMLKANAVTPRDSENRSFIVSNLITLGDIEHAKLWLDEIRNRESDSYVYNAWMGTLALRLGQTDSATRLSQRLGQQLPVLRGYLIALALLRDDDLSRNRAEDALDRYRQSYPEILDNSSPEVHQNNFSAALEIAYLLQAMGANSRAEEVLEETLAVTESIPLIGPGGSGSGSAAVFALMGRKQDALAEIRRSVDAGWRATWWYYFDHYAPFESLRGEPEFQAVRAEVEADMAEQLAAVREMEANGDIQLTP